MRDIEGMFEHPNTQFKTNRMLLKHIISQHKNKDKIFYYLKQLK